MTLTEIIAITAAAISFLYNVYLMFLWNSEYNAKKRADRARKTAEYKLANLEKILELPADDVVIAIKEYKQRKEDKE